MVDRLANSEANSKRINVVEGCFGAAGQPLAIPGRVLIGEGVLTKMCRKKPKARQFFLFNDILVYGNIVIQKKKYNKQHIIPLENVTIDSIEDEGELRNGWLIKTPTKSFAVYAATATEKSEWMNHISKCVSDLLDKSGKAPNSEHAAVWVPDSEATVCMRCQKIKFTPVSRRHHCRKCGFVVTVGWGDSRGRWSRERGERQRTIDKIVIREVQMGDIENGGAASPGEALDAQWHQSHFSEDDSQNWSHSGLNLSAPVNILPV
ncbi:PKHF2 protein, partial [Polyodon spathula]|nr:PKHF2 protein [Polyodon spathula]